ncbi:MAG: hypothetical protein Q7U98_02180 [Methylicorpusculum sp.]|uniref:DUF2232 domain-containing protein n=1 Tax=Methylicorpusculum sp. TaxID=2713644 RepID=UPI002723B841|nr:DUF2232 domain-containing protein [Methylicorpusculum sp.]MDO8843055.1 hypothetical protein [Methylicorpusculum sp.]MDO8937945.1 hypothetical protein [Methylicorpusculum sp.]MDP2201616.1 hypothetical protein [Methylicorpusculum sp.]
MKFLAEFIMRGRMSAMMVASTLALISLILPPVSIVSSATVALVTLRRGAYEGLYVLISSSVAAALLGFLVLGGYQFALLYGLVLWIPIWLISIVLREGRHLSLAVEIAVLLGAAAVLLFYGVQEDPARLWESVLVQIAKPMMDANPDVPMESVQQSLKTFARFMTGIIAAGAVYGMLFGLFLGRWWQATLYNPGGFRQEFLALSTHPRLAIGSVLVVLAAWWTSGVLSEAAWNVSILFFVLYTFIGSAVLHNLLARTKISHFLVPMMYVTLLLIPHVMLPVAVLGLLDTWLNLRNKFLVIEPK